jgi:hypothetical protein
MTGDECVLTLSDVRLQDVQPPADYWHSCTLDGGGVPYERRPVIGEADCMVDRGLEAVLRGMTVGELREFCLGDGRGGRVSGRVQLSAVVKGRGACVGEANAKDDDQRKVDNALRYKDTGNRLYGQSRYVDAFHRYRAALQNVLFMRTVNTPSWNSLYCTVVNNMAACQLRLDNQEHVHRLCTKVLTVQPDNLKALVRRCHAAVELKLYKSAADDARQVLTREPHNSEAKRYLDEAERGIQVQEASYRDMVRKMFA